MTSRIALVTGASAGIGASCAAALSAAGHRVALMARGESALQTVAATLPGQTLVVPGDVTSRDSVEATFAQVEQHWGPVEVLVHCAGSGASKPLVDTSDDQWQQMLDLNLTAPFRCLRRALPGMTSAGFGRIVVVASVVAKRGESRVAAYTASKHGALGLVRAAAAEVARTGVTVNAVCPGYVDTPMTESTISAIASRKDISHEQARELLGCRQPIGRLVTPDEVADAVMLCVGSGAITGQGINVDGGAVQS
ncbi:SDR family NAD(P)-dependent oxidoreductase [Leekyejoonella antrihumi]|uniref:SDR family oxidoreductase n=1 Tax=Leekyejoonella antrihumi TaxID=1660198 RepID=A0A563DYU4_9MICO|nr:SDR family oxidoreductase [Leekyejoonella antrihumi]TWP35430.1 SDR family oxidoreductase [Leekyejoonella antrihumi]